MVSYSDLLQFHLCEYQIRRLGFPIIPLLCCCRGGTGVCKGQCEGTAALCGGGGGLCWMEHCSHTDEASAQLLSEEGLWRKPHRWNMARFSACNMFDSAAGRQG